MVFYVPDNSQDAFRFTFLGCLNSGMALTAEYLCVTTLRGFLQILLWTTINALSLQIVEDGSAGGISKENEI